MNKLSVEAINISKSFGKKSVFDSLNFKINPNDRVHLQGENGSGKTTLIRMISSLINPCSGEVLISGLNVQKNQKKIISLIGLVAGQEKGFFPRLTGKENLHFFRLLAKKSTKELTHFIAPFKELPLFQEIQKTPYYLCSKGMKQILAFMIIMLKDPKILLLDEPFTSLDQNARSTILDIIDFNYKDKIIIFAEHEKNLAKNLKTREFIFKDGTLIC